jgi:hypothetical protein
MHETSLSQAQALLFQRFKEIGGCVDYVVLDCDPGQDGSAQELHRKAAVAGLKIIAKRWAAYAAKTSAEQNIPIGKFFSMRIECEKAGALAGNRISDREFLGPGYDYDRKELAERQSYSQPAGYAYAFSDPPYTLYDHSKKKRVSLKEATELFQAINKEVLGGISPESVIFEWPVDWSNYFDAGQEWWGSFLWTFANPGTHRIIMLAASTTD